jgi:hypothetical protein
MRKRKEVGMRAGKRKRDKSKGRCQKMRAEDQDERDEFWGRATYRMMQ